MRTAVIIGRFQPLHKGHLAAIVRLARTHGRLLILIGSAQYSRTAENPLSGIERKSMVRYVLRKRGISGRARIVLLEDVHDNARWTEKARRIIGKPENIEVFSNNPLVRRLLCKHYRVGRLVSGIRVDSTRIRAIISMGGAWKALVPREVAAFLEGKRLVEVIAGT
ncbi:MAG: adenylyltransferase/cytidyltransferase family protein [Candidatus Micrarchaeota archaeon]